MFAGQRIVECLRLIGSNHPFLTFVGIIENTGRQTKGLFTRAIVAAIFSLLTHAIEWID